MDGINAYEKRKKRLINELLLAKRQGSIGLAKSTSNLFRYRQQKNTGKIDVRKFNHVLGIDEKNLIAEVEGMTTYEDLVKETLKFGLLPAVVPQLKSITIGGAVSGGGIESSSFKYGLVHETILEMEVLLSNGTTVICSKKRNKDLFFGLPNSYGTLGYILKVKVKLIPAKKFVKIRHLRYHDAKQYFKDLKTYCSRKKVHDFIDGTIFGRNELYITLGTFVDSAPFVSNYKYMKIYYKSIRKKKTDYLAAADYIWRWDTDWFWCSKHFFVQNPLVRMVFGPFCLKSTVYSKLMRLNRKYKIERLFGKRQKTESVIQDVQIPIDNCAKFLSFFQKEIGISPVWVCPTAAYDKKSVYNLYVMNPFKLYVNFGFWDVVPSSKKDGYYNRKIERKVKALHGKKSLYSNSFYSRDEFWKLYNKKKYDILKAKYDPSRHFRDLYEKCVQRA